MKGYLVIDDISLDEATKLLKRLRKNGRWVSVSGMAKLDTAAGFAILTHGFPKPKIDEEIVELHFKKEEE